MLKNIRFAFGPVHTYSFKWLSRNVFECEAQGALCSIATQATSNEASKHIPAQSKGSIADFVYFCVTPPRCIIQYSFVVAP